MAAETVSDVCRYGHTINGIVPNTNELQYKDRICDCGKIKYNVQPCGCSGVKHDELRAVENPDYGK